LSYADERWSILLKVLEERFGVSETSDILCEVDKRLPVKEVCDRCKGEWVRCAKCGGKD